MAPALSAAVTLARSCGMAANGWARQLPLYAYVYIVYCPMDEPSNPFIMHIIVKQELCSIMAPLARSIKGFFGGRDVAVFFGSGVLAQARAQGRGAELPTGWSIWHSVGAPTLPCRGGRMRLAFPVGRLLLAFPVGRLPNV